MTTALTAIAVITVIGGLVVSASIPPIAAYASKEDRGNGWPKTAYYIPRNAEGLTGLTIAQCDSPEQCKEVNGTPSPNVAAKKFCEEISGEKCVRLSGIPNS